MSESVCESVSECKYVCECVCVSVSVILSESGSVGERECVFMYVYVCA